MRRAGRGFARLLATLFFLAVDRRFGEQAIRAIIRFVGELRADLADGGPDVDPLAAEAFIRATIDTRPEA